MSGSNSKFGFSTMGSAMGSAVKYPAWVASHFAPYISGRVMEVGLGFSNYRPLYTGIDSYVGVDIDEEVLALAKETGNQSQLVQAKLGEKNFEARVLSDRPDVQFDACVCFNTLQYVEDEWIGVRQLLDCTRPGGYVNLLIPAHQFLFGALDRGSKHRYRYSKSQAEQICLHNNAEVLSIVCFNPVGGLAWGAFNITTFLRQKIGAYPTSNDLGTASGGDAGTLFFDQYLVEISRALQFFFKGFFGLSFAIVLQKKKNT